MTQVNAINTFIEEVLNQAPADWLKLTTHRLDIYNENAAKTEFLDAFNSLFNQNSISESALKELPTAYDYIRLGHPLSSVLEWMLAKQQNLSANQVISFQSRTMPLLAILRKNQQEQKSTRVLCSKEIAQLFDVESLTQTYNYQVEFEILETLPTTPTKSSSTTVLITEDLQVLKKQELPVVDFTIHIHALLGSILVAQSDNAAKYVSEIQHVRRRESVAMTPQNCFHTLNQLIGNKIDLIQGDYSDLASVRKTLKSITNSPTDALVASSGLSIQYAVVMGLIDHARQQHPSKVIHLIVPPNCYGGTNDQARRVAAAVQNVSVVDLPVDGKNDMVNSVNHVLNQAALADAVPLIIAEIPTNPRVEVPNLLGLREALKKNRNTPEGSNAIAPVFILDQTFCPNVHFLGKADVFDGIQTLSYVSGSKFPSGGLCTAGYTVGNDAAKDFMPFIEKHLHLCDNQATPLQLSILAKQLPSMNQRIQGAYENTRAFVNFIEEVLPQANINFVSEELASEGFTPSVFSLDLPTKGNTDEEREAHKRMLNLKLINLMITQIPSESKYCVSYGQLKGCYWTIPATSTQGTTQEGDKDYIVRVALSANMNLEKHKAVFTEFVHQLEQE